MPSPNRTSDPIQNQRSQSKVAGKEKTQTQIDRWIEPPVAIAASYTDHGGAPYGVLDGMQALGDLPSAKVRGRVKGEGVRKSVLGRASAADADGTPGGSPAPQPPTPQPADLPAPHTLVIDDEKDDDYAPKLNGKRKDRVTRNRGSKRVSQPASSVTPAPTPAPTLPKAPAVMATSTPAAAAAPALSASQIPAHPTEYDGDKLKRVVEAAKARAIDVGKPDLAAAVNEIYEQSKSDLNLRILLQAILSQRASHDQNARFQDYVRAAKKKLKDAKQRERQEPPVSKATEAQPKSITKPLPSKLSLQSTPLLQPPGAARALPSTEPAEPPKGKISLKVKSPTKHQHRRKPGKVMSISPKKRSGSVGSDSSLTDLTSNDEDDGMDLDADDDELHRGPPPAYAGVRTNGVKDQAAERGSLTVPSGGAKRSSAEAELEDERDRILAAKKQKLGESVRRDYDFTESSVRPALNGPKSRAQQVRSEALAPRLTLHASGSRTGSARPSRAVSMDIDSPLSSPAGSRQSTPKVLKPAPKPFNKRAKTKQSPEKKQLGGFGNVALRESPVGDDDNEDRSENNDYCSACHGSGYLLCCDGCDRSFHFTCLDPPLNGNAKELDEPWYCFTCVANRPPMLESPEKAPTTSATRIFAPLLGSLKRRNPKNFELPQELREYFEGVATDKNGSFMEALNNKPTRNRPGYSDEQPDYTRLRDSKGVLVTCFRCHESSQSTETNGPKRAIVTCDHCGQHWHLDCLDPPLANPPALNQNGKKVHDWMCPLHADQELRNVPMAQLNRPMTQLNRKLHIRKPKVAKVVETALSRGHRNNGIIEVLDDESESDSEFYDQEQEDGVIYKLPASGIKLDFIDKVKSSRIQKHYNDSAYRKRPRLADMSRPPRLLEKASFAKRPMNEQQAALNLAQFATDNADLNLGADQVQNLVGTLIAEAPSEVVDKVLLERQARACLTPPPQSSGKSSGKSKQPATESDVPSVEPNASSEEPNAPFAGSASLTADQRKELLHLQELIRRRLEGTNT